MLRREAGTCMHATNTRCTMTAAHAAAVMLAASGSGNGTHRRLCRAAYPNLLCRVLEDAGGDDVDLLRGEELEPPGDLGGVAGVVEHAKPARPPEAREESLAVLPPQAAALLVPEEVVPASEAVPPRRVGALHRHAREHRMSPTLHACGAVMREDLTA